MDYVEIAFANERAKERTATRIERSLLRSLAQTNTQAVNEDFVLTATAKDGMLLGGLTAATSYGWLHIKTLWIDESIRKSGLGKRLTELAEAEGRRFGCHSAWLDTSSNAARIFYQKCGYLEFSRLQNREGQPPEGHCRWFMQKQL